MSRQIILKYFFKPLIMNSRFYTFKNIYLLAFCCLSIFQLSAQVTEVTSNLDIPRDLILIGTDLYITEENDDKISKVDISQPLPTTATDVVTGLDKPAGMVQVANYIYFSQFSGNSNGFGKISRIDLAATTPVVEDILTGLDGPNRILIKGNDLYFVQEGSSLYKIDVTDANPTPVLVISFGTFVTDIAIIGNEIFLNLVVADKVVKIDITQPLPLTAVDVVTIDGPIGMIASGNELYISQAGSLDKVVKVDISQPTPTVIDVVSDLSNPSGLLIVGTDLYIANSGNGTVVKQSLCAQPTINNIDIIICGGPTGTSLIEVDGELNDATSWEWGLGSPCTGSSTSIDILGTSSQFDFNFIPDSTHYLRAVGVCSGSTACIEFTPNSLFGPGNITALPDLCVNAGVQNNLGNGSATDATFSGTGVTDNGNGATYSFDPAVAGVGTHIISYTNACGWATTDIVEVFAAPTVTFSLTDTVFVIDGVLPTGIGEVSPAGGIFTDNNNVINDDGNGMTFSFSSTVAIGAFNLITYTYTDPVTGCSNSASQEIFVAATTDVDDLERINLDIFPNPTTGIINFEGVPTDRIEVINVHGKILKVESIPNATLDISNFPSGIYFLRINVEDEVITHRVIKE